MHLWECLTRQQWIEIDGFMKTRMIHSSHIHMWLRIMKNWWASTWYSPLSYAHTFSLSTHPVYCSFTYNLIQSITGVWHEQSMSKACQSSCHFQLMSLVCLLVSLYYWFWRMFSLNSHHIDTFHFNFNNQSSLVV